MPIVSQAGERVVAVRVGRERQVVRVRRRGVVLERLVVGDVVVLVAALAACRRARRRPGGPRRRGPGWCACGDRPCWKPALLNSSGMNVRVGWPGVTGRGQRRLRSVVGRPEAALEPAPGEAGGVQLVADVRAVQRDRVAGRAVVPVRLGVAGQRVAALAVGREVGVRARRRRDRRAVRPRAPCRRRRCHRTTRLIAPGADGPKVVPYELSLIA